jgi:hypothetical protein
LEVNLQVHVIPRRPGDFTPNDALYHELEKDRPPRSEEVMEQEANDLRPYFTDHNAGNEIS